MEKVNSESTIAGSPADVGYGLAPPGYRLPGSARPGRVVLQVADLERSVAFYREVIGLRELSRANGFVALAAFGDDTPLIELRENARAVPVPRRGQLGLYHFAILVPDRASLGRFVEHLARLGARAGASDHLVSEAMYLQDPDGLGIEVYADRPRSSWRHTDRQLAMDTRPLDVEDVVRAAGGEEWTGMPSATVVGHVHLHVGDLGRAEEFYHKGLGLDKIVWSYPGALFLSAGGYHHHLGVNTWAAGASPAGENDAQLLEWEIVLPTVADARAALENLATTGNEMEPTSDGGVARDPWGTALRLRGQ